MNLRTLNALREIEKEKQRLEDVVSPHDMAIQKLHDLATEMQHQSPNNDNSVEDDHNSILNQEEEWIEVCESKQLQMDEVTALEAIYNIDTDHFFLLLVSSQQNELQNKLNDWQIETND
jgi:hypothetical protein